VTTPTLVIHCDRDRVYGREGREHRGRYPQFAVRLAAERQSSDAGRGARLGDVLEELGLFLNW
jgi:hypothetical protein